MLAALYTDTRRGPYPAGLCPLASFRAPLAHLFHTMIP